MTPASSVPTGPETASATPLLHARGVHVSYGDGPSRVEALRGCDMTLEAGEIVAIVGASGSGKSTLLHVLSGLDVPSAGTVTLQGRDLTTLSEDERARWRAERVGYILQRENLIPSLTIEENVAAPMLFSGVARAEAMTRARDMLERVELLHRAGAWPGEVSGGEAQRTAIARACVNRPSFVFADEPTGALDSRTGAIVLELMASLARETGAATVIVTHDPAAAAIADRTVTLRDGEIVDP